MSNVVISVENLTKSYRLGVINTGTFYGDLKRWWAMQRGKPDPYLKIGETDYGNRDGETIWALKEINFTVKQGEILGIIGRNGAGKSTLLKVLSQVTLPTSGVVNVKGKIASLLEVGTGFHPELTGRENTYLNGAIMGMDRSEVARKFDEIVDFSGIEKFIDTPVKRYSSGMYVRLAFAVAAHLEPDILVVDEVLAVGDAEFQKKSLGKMGDVASEGRTVLFVSHNMAAIQHLCGKGIVLDKGILSFQGDIYEAITDYFNLSKKGYDQSISLSNRDDRKGNGDIRIVAVEIRSIRQEALEFVRAGESFDVVLHYEATKPYSMSRVNFGISCYSLLGQRIFIQSMEYTGYSRSGSLPIKGVAICRIESLPLPKGHYTFTSVVKLNEIRVDVIENAFEVNIIDGDYYFPSTTSISASEVICLVKGEWRVES